MSCSSGGKGVLCPGQVPMNLMKPKENKGERLGIKRFYSHGSVSFPCSILHPSLTALLSLSPYVLHPQSGHWYQVLSPWVAPCLWGTPWASPWWLAGTWPIMHQERRGGENCYFLSTPYCGSAIPWSVVLLPVNITLMCKWALICVHNGHYQGQVGILVKNFHLPHMSPIHFFKWVNEIKHLTLIEVQLWSNSTYLLSNLSPQWIFTVKL